MINLRRLEIDSGEAGARDKFERLIGRLMKIRYPSASEIRPNPGDWGIDIYVGKFTSGRISVWQAKYFPKGIDDSQKDQIRTSFKQILDMSKVKGFKVKAWNLCIPCTLSGDEKIWWETWQKEKRKETNISIKLLEHLDIVKMLSTADAEGLCIEFNLKDNAQGIREELPIVPLPAVLSQEYEHALFVMKLLDAKIFETESAKRQFFNAEVVSKEIRYKNDKHEIAELDGLYDRIHSLWEPRFIEATQSHDPVTETAKVYVSMQRVIEEKNNELLYCHRLPLSFFHKKGLMQQMANDCTIGWSPNYKSLAKRT